MKVSKKKIIVIALIVPLLLLALGVWDYGLPVSRTITVADELAKYNNFDEAIRDYDRLLKEYVDKKGLVNYQQLQANPQRLNAYLAALATLTEKKFDAFSQKEKIAFWINAYNAFTLKAIIEHYPIKASFIRSLGFPKNSIRQIPGVWDKLKFVALGKKITLNEIEHKQLRAKFNEPRIHMALVCASIGCPKLRREAFVGDKLDKQLDEHTKVFLADASKFKIDKAGKKVYLSKIISWFGSDFVKSYKPTQGFPGHNESKQASLNFISRYVSPEDADYLQNDKYTIHFLDYDWSLNLQKPKPDDNAKSAERSQNVEPPPSGASSLPTPPRATELQFQAWEIGR